MIPILYEKTETTFASNGLGRLPDAVSCTVTEERNGEYELLLEYPVTGLHYEDLELERIILAKPADNKQPQPFVIYQISRPINGIVTVNAEHISYRLTRMVVAPCSASSAAAAMGQIQGNIMGTHNFTFWSNRTQTGNFSLGAPTVVREVLGGMEGSVLDVYGGEYEFDLFDVKLWNARGVDRGVSIRWQKNVTGIESETAGDSVYTGIVPFWTDTDGNCVYGGMVTSHEGHVQKTIAMDFSDEYEDAPTAAQLEAKAASYLASNTPWVPSENISINFVDLASTTEYQNLGLLQQVNLCDTVHVIYEPLGIDASAKVIRTVYNVLLERYDEIEVGNYQRANLAKEINAVRDETMQAISTQRAFAQEAIDYATKLITGGYGGHIVIRTNANGEPEELLIMDTDDIETAVNVWRWNINGLGHSHSGYEGPYDDIAITMDGKINAAMITTGLLNANIIKAGILQDNSGVNYWNMATGELHITGATQVGNTTLSGMVNEKARVFVTQPVPPYNVGDLWVQGSSGDIYECVTARSSGTYTASDWALASKYTDDSALTAFQNGAYAAFVSSVDTALDQKITTYYQASAPTTTITGDLWIDTDDGNKLYRWNGSSWVSVQDAAIQDALTAAGDAQATADGKIKTYIQTSAPSSDLDVGDLWIDSDDGNRLYRWSGTSWADVQDTAINSAYVLAGSKAKVFTSQPTPPYNVGDLYTNGSDLYQCTTARSTGSYSASDWTLATDYIDAADAGTIADGKVSAYDIALNQQAVFNKLTNNGALQGLYMQNGQLYINATYIVAGRIASVNGRVYFDLTNNELACSKIVEKTLYSANLVAEIQRNFNSSSYPHLAIYLSGVSSSEQYPIRLIPRFRSSPSGSGALVCEDGVEITTASSSAVTTDGQNIRLMTDSSSNKIIHVRTAYNSADRAGIELRQGTDGTSTIQLRSVSGTTIYNGDFYVRYNMQVTGNKNRRVKTEDYEDRLLYCYEMAEPVFGDFGSGVLDENGECIVEIDDIFSETITLDSEYHVFLQKEGQGDLWISEKNSRYFVVSGTPGLSFAWELKAKQWDGIATRLEAPDYDIQDRSGAVPEETYDQEIEQFIHEQEELLSEAAE